MEERQKKDSDSQRNLMITRVRYAKLTTKMCRVFTLQVLIFVQEHLILKRLKRMWNFWEA